MRNIDERFYEVFKNQGKFETTQTKFGKKLGAVTIVKDLKMTIH